MACEFIVAVDVEPLQVKENEICCDLQLSESPDSGRLSYSSDASFILRLPIGSDDHFSSTLSVGSANKGENNQFSSTLSLSSASKGNKFSSTLSLSSANDEENGNISTIPPRIFRSHSLPDIKSDIDILQKSKSFTYRVSTPPINKTTVIPTIPPLPLIKISAITPLPIYYANSAATNSFILDTTNCIRCGSDDILDLQVLPCCNRWICEGCQISHVLTFGSSYGDLPCPNDECQLDSVARKPVEDVTCDPIECIVCYGEITRTSQKHTRPCCSEVVCRSCMVEIVQTNILSEGRVFITCPIPDCDGVVTREEIINLVDQPTLSKYERLRANQELSKSRKTCPNCSELTEHKLPRKLWKYNERDIRITCQKCNHEWCFNCHAPWHKGVSCREFQKGDKRFKKWTKSNKNGVPNCQKCPICRVNIQRSSGCNHMTCNQCKTHFCYQCGGLFNFWVPIFGGHSNRSSIFGCKYNYQEYGPTRRRTLRGGYFGAKLAMLTGYPVLFVVGLAILIVGGAIALPIYGAYKYHKYRKSKRSAQASARRRTRIQ